MFVTLNHILKHPTFREARLIAGREGASARVGRVSVFDCLISDDIIEKNIIEEEDFFISGLMQFGGDQAEFFRFIRLLVETGSSGLCAAVGDSCPYFTDEILRYCDEHRFPVVRIDEDVPYAVIMDTINKFISIDNLNAINELKLEKIMTSRLDNREKLYLLRSINANIEKYIQVIYVKADPLSEITDSELNIEYLNRREDIFLNSSRVKILIASSNTQERLRAHIDVVRQQMLTRFEEPLLGISRVHDCCDIDRALDEARSALETARTMGIRIQKYNPLSPAQLLISLRDSRELHDFYAAWLGKIRQYASEETLSEVLRTVEVYVNSRGDFRKTGALLNQHENTVRYRINKVRSCLGLEDDPIAFHETISLAVQVGLLLGNRRNDSPTPPSAPADRF